MTDSLGDRISGVVSGIQVHFSGPVSKVENFPALLYEEGY